MYKSTSLAIAALAITAAAGGAHAQSQVAAGTLTCTGKGGVGLILGSQKSYDCKFAPAGGGRSTPYKATVTRVGVDLGVTGETTMVWTVLAATPKMAPGLLRGSYAGAAADVAVGVGGGAKALIGGSNKQISLQPLSVQGQAGLNLAVGVAEMTVR